MIMPLSFKIYLNQAFRKCNINLYFRYGPCFGLLCGWTVYFLLTKDLCRGDSASFGNLIALCMVTALVILAVTSNVVLF